MIQEFAGRLDAWVVSAGEELHREVIEVLSPTRAERAAAKPGADAAVKVCDDQVEALSGPRRQARRPCAARCGRPRTARRRTCRRRPALPNSPGGSA